MKRVFIILVMIMMCSSAFAQFSIKPGVRAGANLSSLTNTELKTKTDFYVGAFAAIKFVRFYTLQPELTYSRQGAKAQYSEFDDVEIQYLNISVANKFSPFKDNGLHFIVGPSINIKVGDNDDFNDLESFDFALMGGLGYDFPFGLTLEARYNIGLIDILGSNINNEVPLDEIYLNQYIQIGAAYKFDF